MKMYVIEKNHFHEYEFHKGNFVSTLFNVDNKKFFVKGLKGNLLKCKLQLFKNEKKNNFKNIIYLRKKGILWK